MRVATYPTVIKFQKGLNMSIKGTSNHKRSLTLLFNILSLVAYIGLIACGSSSEDDNAQNGVRFINTNPEISSMRIVMPDLDRSYTLNYGESNQYLDLPIGNVTVQVQTASSPVPLYSTIVNVDDNRAATILFTGEALSVDALEIADSAERAGTDEFKIRFVSAIDVDRRARYDVYVLYPGQFMWLATPVVTDIRFQEMSAYLLAEAADASIILTDAGTGDIVYESGLINFRQHANYTFVFIEAEDGGTPLEGILLEDETR